MGHFRIVKGDMEVKYCMMKQSQENTFIHYNITSVFNFLSSEIITREFHVCGFACFAVLRIQPRLHSREASTLLTELHPYPSCSRGKNYIEILRIFSIKEAHGYIICGDQEKFKLELKDESES